MFVLIPSWCMFAFHIPTVFPGRTHWTHGTGRKGKCLPVTSHDYCNGCDDDNILVLPAVSAPTDLWESFPVQLHWISKTISNSTSWVPTPIFSRKILCYPTVELWPILLGPFCVFLQWNPLQFCSACVILLCFYLFQSPNSVFTQLGQFTVSGSLTKLF